MIEKIGLVKNPLTIIAIFAAIAEIGGTIVLPFISPESQSVYIWFLILFPASLVLLFFATLNFNHKVLYSPSDFSGSNPDLAELFYGKRRNEIASKHMLQAGAGRLSFFDWYESEEFDETTKPYMDFTNVIFRHIFLRFHIAN